MKTSTNAIITIALLCFTLFTMSFATFGPYNAHNIQDVLLALGSETNANINVNEIVTELNHRWLQSHTQEEDTLLYGFDNDDRNDSVDRKELRTSAYYSAIARCTNWSTTGIEAIKKWTCVNCKNAPKLIDVIVGESLPSRVAWYIGYSEEMNQIVVTGRSSTSIENWLYDLDFKGVEFKADGCDKCTVHNGFMKSYQELRTDWLKAIDQLLIKYPTARIRVNGHSLAAAISIHAVLDFVTSNFVQIDVNGITHWHSLTNNGYNTLSQIEYESLLQTNGAKIIANRKLDVVLPFYNFGCPRTGNSEFATFFQQSVGAYNLIRSTHNLDPVPRVPPQNLIWKYRHPSNEIYWYSDQQYKNCNDLKAEDKSCALGNLLPVNILDHIWYNGILLACVLP